ncbi:MAG TPA: MtfD protein [Microscillaceae bacterium]|nr:MtfD protein [Microscillaceae bacterium]
MIKKVLQKIAFKLAKWGIPENHQLVSKDDYVLLPKANLTYAQDLLYTFNNADFIQDSHFIEAYNLGKATDQTQTLLPPNYDIHWRIHVLCWAANQVKHLEGDFVDCGVFSGIFARSVIHFVNFNSLDKTYYLIDTFEGLDERYSTPQELEKSYHVGYHKVAGLYEQVQQTFSPFNTCIIKGSIPDVLSEIDTTQVCFLSVDLNAAQPEIEALHFFWDKLVPGGIIVLDDYGYPGYEGQKKAHDRFAASKNTQILSLPTCQGILIKK